MNLDELLAIHAIILNKINDSWAGILREVAIRITGSQVPRPNYLKVPELMEDLVQYIKSSQEHCATIAAEAHLKLVFIHPFVDGSGRTARLLMNLILLQDNYPLIYLKAEDRQKYIDAIEKALLKNETHEFVPAKALAQEGYELIYKAIEFSLDEYLQAAHKSRPLH